MSSTTTDNTEKGSLKERMKDHNLFPELRNQMKGAPRQHAILNPAISLTIYPTTRHSLV